MSEIKITDLNNLRPAGTEFFADDEGYLANLSEDELDVWGGRTNVVVSIDNKQGNLSVFDISFVSLQDSSISTNQ
ncbi:hypothetical protein [Pantanalinema sp. GBBB05]|uniref:hypothetical protein n=1 Tax=Pantanalinema sp. GBBB05 TaxID=2604139 RepID=UPI001DB4AD66|nr:hypothetical protein [Pantanalinema sp. GBBB05]